VTRSTGVGRGNKGRPDRIVVTPYRAHPDGARLVNSAIPRAMALVQNVRTEGPESVARILDPLTWEQTAAVIVVLAAMVPDDVPLSELTAWVHEPAARVEVAS
jgi:hypothetical protein